MFNKTPRHVITGFGLTTTVDENVFNALKTKFAVKPNSGDNTDGGRQELGYGIVIYNGPNVNKINIGGVCRNAPDHVKRGIAAIIGEDDPIVSRLLGLGTKPDKVRRRRAAQQHSPRGKHFYR